MLPFSIQRTLWEVKDHKMAYSRRTCPQNFQNFIASKINHSLSLIFKISLGTKPVLTVLLFLALKTYRIYNLGNLNYFL